jgi:hypothetical protein
MPILVHHTAMQFRQLGTLYECPAVADERVKHRSHQQHFSTNRDRVWSPVSDSGRHSASERVRPESLLAPPGRVANNQKKKKLRPAGYYSQELLDTARQYYLSSYSTLRKSTANTLQIIHDAFQPTSFWNGWEPRGKYEGVALETHIYDMFSVAVSQIPFGHRFTCRRRKC